MCAFQKFWKGQKCVGKNKKMLPLKDNIDKDFYVFIFSCSSVYMPMWIPQNRNNTEHVVLHLDFICFIKLPWSLRGKEPACNVRDLGSILGLGRSISWIWKWLPTPVFLPGEFPGQRSYSPWATAHGVAKSQTQLRLTHIEVRGFEDCIFRGKGSIRRGGRWEEEKSITLTCPRLERMNPESSFSVWLYNVLKQSWQNPRG